MKSFIEGKVRLLFATEALSMGTDITNIRRIIHVGPPTSLESKMFKNCSDKEVVFPPHPTLNIYSFPPLLCFSDL